jgi:O-acetylhomoserine/O-acetylserine sulfhydrylase-like pyridoxal-dependent enzyme
VNFRPLQAGFDLVFHSATKYLGGHSDLVAGAVMGDTDLVERVRKTINLFGGSLDPHAGFLLARGIKTLSLRVQAQNANALALARFLEDHPAVAAVNYPGLASHPDHAHAAELLSGFGGMLSLRLHGGHEPAGPGQPGHHRGPDPGQYGHRGDPGSGRRLRPGAGEVQPVAHCAAWSPSAGHRPGAVGALGQLAQDGG